MLKEKFDVIGGDLLKKHLSNQEFERLINVWVEDNFEPVVLSISKTREFISRILSVLPLGKECLDVCVSVKRGVENIFPEFSKEKSFEQVQKSDLTNYMREMFQEAIDEGNMVIAERDGRVIGMVKVSKLDKVEKNSLVSGEVVEIGKAFTVPEERGKGVYKCLRD